MKPVIITILSLMLAGAISLGSEPTQENPSQSTTFQFKACRNNCQEFYELCTMRCPPGSTYYMACENDCATRYGECFGGCQERQQEQAAR